MEKEIYIKTCCIQNHLPPLLRSHEGGTAVFYSQGDWGIQKLWDAVSHMVSNTAQDDGRISTTGGKRRILLVVPTLERHLMDIIADYHRRGWFDHLMLVCYSTTMRPSALQQYIDAIGNSLRLIIGQRCAQRQSMWMRWDDATYNALAVFGPMHTRDNGNAPFAQYVATFHDRLPLDKDGNQPVNERGRQMVSDVMQFWDYIDKSVSR